MKAALLATFLLVHDWYDPGCCSGRDCRPAIVGEVTKTMEGWSVVNRLPTAPAIAGTPSPFSKAPVCERVLIPFGDARIHYSKDVAMHVCFAYNGCQPLCLYIAEPAT